MSSHLDNEVLKLNNCWQAIETVTVRKAFEDMAAEAATALRFHDGNPTPYRLEDWLHIPIEDKEDFIGLSHGRKVAIPRVIIAVNFDRLIVKPPKLTLANLRRRDADTCQLSGRKLRPDEMSREHVVPESHGGKSVWTNIVLADKRLNSLRGNRSYKDAGMQLLRTPVAPRGVNPADRIVNRMGYPEWEPWIKRRV